MHKEIPNPNQHMKSTRTKHHAAKSTYALLVRSQEEERSVYETAVYMLFILSAVFSIWQVAQQPLHLPTTAIIDSTTQVAQAQAAPPQRGA